MFVVMVWMSMTNPAKADLYYKTYAGTGAINNEITIIQSN